MRWHVLAVALGALVGLGAGPFVGLTDDAAERLYDSAFPVVEASAEVTHRTSADWRVLMYSRKHRDCRLIEVQAYDMAPTRDVTRLRFEREDGAQPKGTPPGNFRSATYIISPPPKHTLALSFVHECSGRSVRTAVRIKE